MKTIKDLKASLPQVGKIEWIGLRPKRRSDVDSVEDVQLSVGEGLEGDHYSKPGGKRMVTLIQKEHLDVVSILLDKPIAPSEVRRNIMVSGINLLALHDETFSLGSDVVLKGTGYCHPCSRMEENLGPGGYNAMRGHGGITAVVIAGGHISIGSEVKLQNEIG